MGFDSSIYSPVMLPVVVRQARNWLELLNTKMPFQLHIGPESVFSRIMNILHSSPNML